MKTLIAVVACLVMAGCAHGGPTPKLAFTGEQECEKFEMEGVPVELCAEGHKLPAGCQVVDVQVMEEGHFIFGIVCLPVQEPAKPAESGTNPMHRIQ